jgi:hypothetical protein
VKRTLVGAVWGMILYLIIYSIAGVILGGAAESWRPTIALVAAALAAAGSWKGWLPGTRNSKDPSETNSFD